MCVYENETGWNSICIAYVVSHLVVTHPTKRRNVVTGGVRVCVCTLAHSPSRRWSCFQQTLTLVSFAFIWMYSCALVSQTVAFSIVAYLGFGTPQTDLTIVYIGFGALWSCHGRVGWCLSIIKAPFCRCACPSMRLSRADATQKEASGFSLSRSLTD